MNRPMEAETRTPLAHRLLERWMRLLAWIIPRSARARWCAEWDGELWYGVARSQRHGPWRRAAGLAIGILRDALHLRRRGAPLRGRRRRPGDRWVRTLVSDLRYSLRTLRKAPGFTAVVATTLALGIGATTTIFSVVNSLLLHPLPYPDSDRLVIMWQGRPATNMNKDWLSPDHFVEIRDHTDAFEALAITYGSSSTLTGRGPATPVGYVMASSSYLSMLGARAVLGRSLDVGDDRAGASTVAVLTHAFWQRSFGGDPDVVGRTITLVGTDIEIVGVLSSDVLIDGEVLPTVGRFGRVDVILSLRLSEELRLAHTGQVPRGGEDYNVLGRLKGTATLTQAQAELDAVAARVQESYERDPNSGFFIRAVPLMDEVVGGVRQALSVLMGAVGILLLIACVNVANLVLVRAVSRQRALGIRAAVGAKHWRLIQQMFAESALLATLGGALGVGLAGVGIAVVHRLGAATLPRISAIGIDGRVLAVALGLTVATCVLFGLAPAWRTSRIELTRVLRPGGRGTMGKVGWSALRPSSALVSAEIALSLVLLIGGGLLVRSIIALHGVDPGFQPEGRLTFRVHLSGDAYDAHSERLAFYRRLKERLERLPGVEAASGVSPLPFADAISWAFLDFRNYVPPQGKGHTVVADLGVAMPCYFGAMGIPILRGRGFDERDGADGPRVALIDETFARTYFPDRDPIGMQIVDWSNQPRTIIGVTGRVMQYGLDTEARVTAYYPLAQLPPRGLYIVVRTTGDPEALIAPATRTVHQLDDGAAVTNAMAMTSRLADSLAARRFSMVLLQVFSAVALILAAVGVYGLVSYRVTQGARDLGLRLALGAPTASVFALVLRYGLALAAIGITVGLFAALAVTGFMRSMLFGVSAFDTATFITVTAVLAGTTLIACAVPARRATRVDPLDVIRSE